MTRDLYDTVGSFDGEPVVWAPGEAWVTRDERPGIWSRTCSAEIAMHGRVLSRAAFDAKFPLVRRRVRHRKRPVRPVQLRLPL